VQCSLWYVVPNTLPVGKYDIANLHTLTLFRDIFLRIYIGFTLSQATKALRESRGIALLYF